MNESFVKRVEDLEKKVAELEEQVPAQVNGLIIDSTHKKVRNELIQVLKNNQCTFGTAIEILILTQNLLQNSINSRLIMPYKVVETK